MWLTFEYEDDLYMTKAVLAEEITVYLTNFKNIWSKIITKEAVLERFAEMNPLIDTKLEDAVNEVLDLVRSPNQKSLEISEEMIILTILATFEGGYNVKFKFELEKTSDKFLTEVTVPLIQTVKYLEDRQNMLSNLIQKKDRELEEYKLEKGEISRSDLVTEKFDENTLNQIDDDSMLGVFKEGTFWNAFVHKHGNIQATIEEVKKDPWNHIQRKRKVWSSSTSLKRGKGIDYSKKTNKE